MYGGGYGAWNQWGYNSNTQDSQQQGQQQQQQKQNSMLRPGVNQPAQAQQQQLGNYNAMGYSGFGAGTGNAGMGFQQGSGYNQGAMMGNMSGNTFGYQGANAANIHPYMNFAQQQQQQNSYMQQQQVQQSSTQPLFQTNVAFARPQPPLPPGPPPSDTPSQTLFNSVAGGYGVISQPPLPNAANLPQSVPPPPPDSTAKNNSEPQIPEAILKLLQNADVQRQFMQATEALSAINPLMSLNVSQDLFGSKSKSKGIPGLDFSESDNSDLIKTEKVFSDVKKPLDLPLPGGIQKVSPQDTAKVPFKQLSEEGKKQRKNDEIKWELRDEVSKSKEIKEESFFTDELVTNFQSANMEIEHQNSEKDEKLETDPLEPIKEEADENESFAASIPLQKDGKPVEYDRKTLKVFDKKFREWEKQFENWKDSNRNHPDAEAYKKYMDQWTKWREQLIEQRRFIIDSMNKARLEAGGISVNWNEGCHEEPNKTMEDTSNSKNGTPQFGKVSQGVNSPSFGSPAPTMKKIAPPPPPLKLSAPPPPAVTPKMNLPFQSSQDIKSIFNEGQNRMENNSTLRDSKLPDSQKSAPVPSLFDINVSSSTLDSLPPPRESFDNKSKNDRDRPVERIPRDRDRQGPTPSSFSKGNANANQNKPQTSPASDRVARDPHENKGTAAANPFTLDEVTWEMPTKNSIPFDNKNSNKFRNQNANPFEVAQNPFVQAANPFMWDQSGGSKPEVRLPTLSDFLQKDDCKVTDDYLNRRGFGSKSDFDHEHKKESKHPTLQFEATSKLLPLVVAVKPKAPIPSPVTPIEDFIKKEDPNQMSQWFTRDRGGVFEEDEFTHDEPYGNDVYNDNAPAVIDYGHGAVAAEDDEYDIPRCERMANQEDDNDYHFNEDDDTPANAVTIDYGHGSVSVARPVGLMPASSPYEDNSKGDYFGDNQYKHYDRYQAPPTRSRGHGRGSSMYQGRGRGRGNTYDAHFADTQYSTDSFEHGISSSHGDPSREKYNPPPGPHSHPRRELMTPSANRGKGRGVPTRFGGGAIDDFPEDSEFRPRKAPPETERVDSPEVILIEPERSRKAPPRTADHDKDRKYSSRQEDSRNVHNSSRDRSRDNDDRNRVRRGDPSFADDRRRSDRPDDREQYSWEYEDDRRNKRDETERESREPSRTSRRDRDNREPFREQHGRVTRRSRSRSPLGDKNAAVHRNLSASQSGTVNSRLFPSSSNPPAPRYQTVLIEDILNKPGRAKRPSQILIVLRGLPGSGKSYVAKLIKDKEVDMGESAPRILSLDDYFMQETVKVVKDKEETVMQYEYEADLEPKYRSDLVKTLKKNIENGYFPFIIVDCVNDQVKHLEEMVTIAMQRKFQVYIAEVEESVETCVKRNIHHRTLDEIKKIKRNWQNTPSNYVRLDVRTLLQDEAVQDVEMEDVSDTENIAVEDESDKKKDIKVDDANINKVVSTTDAKNTWEDDDPDNNEESQYPETSKWEKIEPSEEKLNRLDGLGRKRSGKDEDKVDSSLSSSIESWLQSHLPEDYTSRQQHTRPGQKRVRWADIEEKRAQERMRDVGFVVGHTDWNRMTDPTFGDSALTRTKYI